MEKKNIDYIKMEGEAVFYGPKIDIKLKDSLERLWQATTIQFDFNLPERFELEYMDKDGEKKNVFTIHRALLGSFERFIGVLIEEYAGAFPVWLSPVQVSILPIAERHIEYSKKVSGILKENDIRVEIDDSSEKLGAKIRNAEMKRIPYILIIGDKEIENQTVSIRKRNEGDIGSMNAGEFIEKVLIEIKEKRIN
jgi:threonyl-tRNA synthetase